ncbi:hypothetical protein D1AOALGA4SA_114 [Olavius algarvensis Delta 1 endosymbiont]|nr:hypothetical protein D1AOALGA4SA_114 [Olavius algarvensis Delta 1 endosymbiont]
MSMNGIASFDLFLYQKCRKILNGSRAFYNLFKNDTIPYLILTVRLRWVQCTMFIFSAF